MKKLLLILLMILSIKAEDINQAVYNIIGSEDYNTHSNLIKHIFKDQNSFYSEDSLDYTKLLAKLEENKLLKLNYDSTKTIDVVFIFNSSPKKSFKNINDILKAIGYQNFISSKQTVKDEKLFWSIKLTSAAAINPLRLSSELNSINCKVLNIKKEGEDKWSYLIDSSNSSLYKVEDLVTQSSLSLRKPTRPYYIELANSKEITIESKAGTVWHPNVVFYDSELNVVKVVKKEKSVENIKISVPSETRFVKIDDFFALTNIKNGLNITKE
ncbi:hypothetical protein [Aliarcobacter thereius]|nr:hypothetical protein [Aliarcobacter thereius]OCL94959.1 hypothetical protein AA347_00405 [Aliarcobacter thereius LMG 24486]HJE02656.1 hypothetical protein [Aliarcobacter thereius]